MIKLYLILETWYLNYKNTKHYIKLPIHPHLYWYLRKYGKDYLFTAFIMSIILFFLFQLIKGLSNV